MLDMERQKECFKNHVAKLTDYGNIKILDFKNPNSSDYRIRFLFEEDYCRLHISGDLGDLIASNYSNMTYDKFSDFINNTDYFEEKIDCHSRKIYRYDEDEAKIYLAKIIKDNEMLDDLLSIGYGLETIEDVIEEILEDFDDTKGLGQSGYEKLTKADSDAWEYASDIGKEKTGILDLYMLAFKLAKAQLTQIGI